MNIIYKITNDINGKVYIGKTSRSLDQRWKEHCQDYKDHLNGNRILYKAMNKYGIEHFHIEQIDLVEDIDADLAEQSWISAYSSFGDKGYNATVGGDGKPLYFTTKEEVELLVQLFNSGKNCTEISEIFNCDRTTVSIKLKSLGFTVEKQIPYELTKKKVLQIDKQNGEIIQLYDSIVDAAIALGNRDYNKHIASVCSGERKSAYGYKWEYKN